MLPLIALLPGATFLALLATERALPRSEPHPAHAAGDWILNLGGLAMQGLFVPAASLALTNWVLRPAAPDLVGILPLGFWGAFALNFVVVDFLYYWQHRAMHEWRWLLRWHASHHSSPRVDVWASSRNTLLTNLLFVYFLVNPWAALLSDAPEGFFAGAMATAALDVWRHARIGDLGLRAGAVVRAVSWVFIIPAAHHRHHDATASPANYGANLSIWDRMFGTYSAPRSYPAHYSAPDAPDWKAQLFYPPAPRAAGSYDG